MIPLIIKTSAIILSAILYRLGGAKGYNTKYRDFGVPIIAYITMAFILGISAPWWVHLLSQALMFGALTTYWDDLFGEDNFFIHGGAVAFAYLPYAIVGSISWLAFSVRVIALAFSMRLWHKYSSNAVVEEVGRGAFIILTLFLY